MSYFTTVDFSAMRYADMCEACKGFRKVHHRAMYVSENDLRKVLCRFSPQMLEIDEEDEQTKGFAYAAGVAMARYRRSLK